MKRLNLDDPNVWNKWRELYYDLTPDENIEFGNDIFARFPNQTSFNANPFKNELTRFFNNHKRGASVLEIGGWRGELALECFKARYPIFSWSNIDMCKAAVDNTLTELGDMKIYPYTAWFPHVFDWFEKLGEASSFDICFSAHTIEHLTGKHLFSLLKFLSRIPTIVLEAPITEEGQTWDNYVGTHILELGWKDISEFMWGNGYIPYTISETVRVYRLAENFEEIRRCRKSA